MTRRYVPNLNRVVVSAGREPITVGTENDRVDGLGVTRLNHQLRLQIGSDLICFGSLGGSLWHFNAAVLSCCWLD